MEARMRPALLGAIAGLVLALCAGVARAAEETYPTGTVTVVTPFAPGGGSDVVTRILAEGLRKQLGRSVIVQNIGGAGGVIGTQFVARAQPDGYTLLLHHVGMATAPALYKDLAFDPVGSFAPIGLFADMPMIIVSAKSFAPSTLDELVAYMRQRNGDITFASSGMGSATYLCALLFQDAVGMKATMVQYKGAGPALFDVQTGRVDLLCDVTAGIAGHVKSDTVKGFVLTADRRLASLPDLPTAAEAGMKGVSVSAWYGLYAPVQTPKKVIDLLSTALQAINQDPDVARALAAVETVPFEPAQATPEALRARLAAQIALWTPIIKKAEAEPN
jgi:tripartite-type tricarboxylate transporter receptor subunit TctC